MLRQEQIAVVIDAQKEIFLRKKALLTREVLNEVPIVKNFATIITGIRRCGKSTLLLQVLQKNYQSALYLNFEDIRLTSFETADFVRLQKEAEKRKLKILFLDEVQLIEKWQIFVHQLLREDYTVFVTGSNASLLSRELGTHLTGRHMSMELFPFSYQEYISFKKKKANIESFQSYLLSGGMPEYVKLKSHIILQNLLEDILVRDIAVRYGLRDVESLKQIAIYLLSNTGAPVSANKLTKLFKLKSSTTILEYFTYLKNAYLVEFLPQFHYSIKAQVRNPKKVYAMDTGIITAVSTSFSENKGRLLENLIYLHLRRRTKELYFYHDKGECDFVIFNKGKAASAIQVCYQLNDTNQEREYNGLLQALLHFKLTEGKIVTYDQEDELEMNGHKIKLVPAYKYLQGE